MSGEEAAIRALIDERIAAIREHDAARATATLAPDAVAFELAPPLRLGPDQALDAAGLQAWLDGWQGPVEIEVTGLVIETDGEVGFAHSLNRLRGSQAGGRGVDFWMRSTLGLRKVDGAWKIAHGHSSVPFHMDGSFRAALDLQP